MGQGHDAITSHSRGRCVKADSAAEVSLRRACSQPAESIDATGRSRLMCAHMQLARVIGTVVASQKYEGLEGAKFLLVQPLDHAQKPVGGPAVAVDTVRAGPGELVYTVGSREAALALTPWFVPVDLAIVGIVDDVATTPRETAASVFESVASSSRTRGVA
jgi:ethanolamine utilization protein EutN